MKASWVAVVDPADAPRILKKMKKNKYGAGSVIIGEVVAEHAGQVVMKTTLGASRIIDMPVGELLPRISDVSFINPGPQDSCYWCRQSPHER